ncbi:MAG: type II toxin-antitoxin system Phd/YefM family antitoxin [Caldilinea sp. CFX5]|nr:type II toxin-antitoxin system Phd/YefM family antitoxin [Caldilinea sp. CFX5]
MSDLYKIPPTVPVSELSKHPDHVFEQLAQQHILLTRQGKAAGVLVHPTVWNRILERLENDEATILALEAELNIATGQSELVDISEEMLQAWIQATDEEVNSNAAVDAITKTRPARIPRDAIPA